MHTDVNHQKSKSYSYRVDMFNLSIFFYDLPLICPVSRSEHQSSVKQEKRILFRPCQIEVSKELIVLRAI